MKRLAAAVVLVPLLLSSIATAGPDPADRCAAAKVMATGKRFAAISKCRAKGLLAGAPADAACLAKAEDKFLAAFAKAEASGACRVAGDSADVDAAVAVCVDPLYEDIERECGDGRVAPSEDCDDGGVAGGDGCSSDCASEPGFDCGGEPTVCSTVCGDGLIRGQEECDDNNTDHDDGCAAACVEEVGYGCGGEPSVCTTVCGDGLVRGGEQCDDDNLDPDDGCSAACSSEGGWNCAGEPTTCTCSIATSVTPPSGLRLPQTLTIDASGSYSGCGLPLQYFWGCSSGTSPECGSFLAAANANGNTTASATLTLYELDSFDITMQACFAGTSTCAPVVTRQYNAAEVGP